MAYRLRNVNLQYETKNVRALAELIKDGPLVDGKPTEIIVAAMNTVVSASNDPQEIANAVTDVALKLASQDNITTDVLVRAGALLKGIEITPAELQIAKVKP